MLYEMGESAARPIIDRPTAIRKPRNYNAATCSCTENKTSFHDGEYGESFRILENLSGYHFDWWISTWIKAEQGDLPRTSVEPTIAAVDKRPNCGL